MTIFTRDLSHRIVLYVLLLLFSFQFLPCVTCQEELESVDPNGKKVTAESVIGIVLLAMFLLALVVCCLHYGFFSAEIEAGGHEVLHSTVRRGLDKDVIESFPAFLYSHVKGLKIGKGGVECAICLSEFEDEELLRWMPPCSHTFHTNCIDMWLSSRSTCPVCRANLSMKPGESFPFLSTDLEMGNAERGVRESPGEISLTGSVTWNNNANCRTPRSRSTGLSSSWHKADIFFPRSHSTGHSLVRLGENLDRFTLQLPDEMQRELVCLNLMKRSHIALPQARSSRQGYRSGSVGNERSGFTQGRQTLRRAISTSLSFSFQAAPIRSTFGRDHLMRETTQANDKHFGERSFQRLMP
ncbi:PREDICTED: putative RING-H2 finger protein ATL37 [Camelina sativa]|uniref:RING-type E3 ubiquitin transferase n=1 Tax=Camelina sativa TaxID=90675 RepID=A0ABM0VFC3_CAMSA|nr:PREDICTED: putative RING-H2 finger protein ATL37 [Camelina sativa]